MRDSEGNYRSCYFGRTALISSVSCFVEKAYGECAGGNFNDHSSQDGGLMISLTLLARSDVPMIFYPRGFLLLEALTSLAVLVLMSSLILSWSMGRVQMYQRMKERVQGLFLARSAVDLLTLKKALIYDKELWDISLEERKDQLLPLVHVFVTVRRNTWPPDDEITLTSAYAL